MRKTVSKIILIILVMSIVLGLSACLYGSETEPYLMIEQLAEKEFYNRTTYHDLELSVNLSYEYDESDINVVIADDSIIDITFEKKETFLSEYISFDIICKTTGTTTFYFETKDHSVKSEEVEITIFENIKSIYFDDDSNIVFYKWSTSETSRGYEVETYSYISDVENFLEFVSENAEVATIEFDEGAWFPKCVIKKVGEGETYIYIQSKDKTIRSQKIKVIVEGNEREEASTAETTVKEEPTKKPNSRTVYVTPTGKKYHYKKSCAGKNARETTEDSAKKSYGPCKKCVG